MESIAGFDHVALTVAQLDVAFAFYRDMLGARLLFEYAPQGKPIFLTIRMGGAVLNLHQTDNGLAPVARRRTPGSADFCIWWNGPIGEVQSLLQSRGVAIVEGPVARTSAGGQAALSVYCNDPDGNLLEFMAAA